MSAELRCFALGMSSELVIQEIGQEIRLPVGGSIRSVKAQMKRQAASISWTADLAPGRQQEEDSTHAGRERRPRRAGSAWSGRTGRRAGAALGSWRAGRPRFHGGLAALSQVLFTFPIPGTPFISAASKGYEREPAARGPQRGPRPSVGAEHAVTSPAHGRFGPETRATPAYPARGPLRSIPGLD